ncbi:hypothetical protein NMY22_g8306 [Coprinellus aureogranulatus]|nr:hypothetical protein NMY22_g8306 [Coprinellus aureogranulatus]
MPSTSSYPVTPVEIPGQSDDEDGPSAIGEGGNAGLDLQEDWEEVSREEEDSKDDGASENQELDSREAAVTVEENVQEAVVDATEDCAEALSCDDPPLPDIPLLDAEESGQEDTALVESDGEGEMATDFSCADPPLPEIEAVVSYLDKDDCSDAQLDREDEVGDVATELTVEPAASSVLESPSDEKERPAWSIRASEAPRLGLSTEQEPAVFEKRASSMEDSPEDKPAAAIAAPEPIARSNSIPGAFPALSEAEAEADPEPTAAVTFPVKEEKSNAESSLTPPPHAPPRRRTASTIDTSSFAAAVVSLRRKPEPLDVALAMQMRPGVGAGADPAWMVRFMMAVFGWLAVTMSAGID